MTERVHTFEIWIVLFIICLVGYGSIVGMPSNGRELLRLIALPLFVSTLAAMVSFILRRV